MLNQEFSISRNQLMTKLKKMALTPDQYFQLSASINVEITHNPNAIAISENSINLPMGIILQKRSKLCANRQLKI